MTDYERIYNEDYFNGKNSFFYSFGYAKYSKFYFNNLFRPLKSYIKKYSNARVLDVGCAYGLLLNRLPDHYEKYGVDVSEHAVGEAVKRNPGATIIRHSAEEEFTFPSDYFDIVICNDVIEHIEDPTKVLKNIARVVKPGGIVYLNTPNLNWFRAHFYKTLDRKEHHISLFKHRQLMQLIKDSGLQVMDDWTYTSLTYFFFVKFKSSWGLESALLCTKTA